jgi:hypothetical protein
LAKAAFTGPRRFGIQFPPDEASLALDFARRADGIDLAGGKLGEAMPVQPAFDMRRAQFILRDLLKSTQGHVPMLELSSSDDSTPRLRGVANCSGLLRLGLRLALAAVEAGPIISVTSEGTVTDQEALGVMEIVLTEDTELRRPREPHFGMFGCAISVVVLTILVFALIGFGATLNWVGKH